MGEITFRNDAQQLLDLLSGHGLILQINIKPVTADIAAGRKKTHTSFFLIAEKE